VPDLHVPDTHRWQLPVAPQDRELIAASLWAAGALGVWERPGETVAWFTDRDVDLPPALAGGSFTVERDRDWQADWKATITPVHAGRFVVVPTWLADDHTAASDETTLMLDPGRAFGSGHHATTALCLALLDDLELSGRRVADIGCGSGVLAIAAASRGAITVGTDVDPEAVTVSAENAVRNAVDVAVAEGSVATAVDLLGGPADLVVANLVTDTVVALAPELVDAVRPGGMLVASGIAAEREDRAVGALETAGLEVREVRHLDGWIAVSGRRSDPNARRVDAVAPTTRRR
jgi:ribosomal protein L11 methyltransferase